MTDESLSICFVVNAVSETSVPADIGSALVKYTDIQVDILTWFYADGFEADDQIGVTSLGDLNSTPGADLRKMRAAVPILDQYDIVQVHHNHSGSLTKPIARYLGIPLVSREGNMREGFTRKGRVANGLTNPLADRVVCNSRAVYESFKRWETAVLSPEKIAFIPNGVDFDRIEAARESDWSARETAGITDETIVIGTAAMLTEQKDQATLIRALTRARSRSDESLELVIAGDGPLQESLRTVAADNDVADAVHFLGYLERQKVYQMLGEIDIYAMPSLWEGFSAAAVEGLALENPAVFSDIPPFAQPYSDIAKFHPVGDAVTLADHLVELAANPGERARLAAASRELVEAKYEIETVANRYRDLYDEIL